MRRIVSVWLPAWPIERMWRANLRSQNTASCINLKGEQSSSGQGRSSQSHCEFQDAAFALVESGSHGILITACNRKAAQAGIYISQALTDARAILPNLKVREAEPLKDAQALLALARWCGRYGPFRNCDSTDSIWIDITGVAHLFDGEEKLTYDIYKRISHFGFQVRIGIADTLGAAYALARFANYNRTNHSTPELSIRTNWAIAAPHQTRTALRDLPVEGLRLSADTVTTLKRLGLRHIGQLYDLPRTGLERRFQETEKTKSKTNLSRTQAVMIANVLTRLDQALGNKAEPRLALSERPHLSIRTSWAEPLISLEGIEGELSRLANALITKLERHALGYRRLQLSLFRTDGSIAKIQVGTSAPSRSRDHLMELFKERLNAIDAGFGIDVLELNAVSSEPLSNEQAAISDANTSCGWRSEDISQLIDRLSNRLGNNHVYRLHTRQSHIPEQAQIKHPALAPLNEKVTTSSPNTLPFDSSDEIPETFSPSIGRPFLLLPQAEPITVIAEVPDGAPLRFTWRRITHSVVRAEGPQRIAPEWWRDLKSHQKTRDYYTIEVKTGARYWVYRDGLYGEEEGNEATSEKSPRWFLHGLFG